MSVRTRNERIASVAALGDPTSREMFEFVTAAAGAVTRDAAADALGVSRRIAAAHLDKLAEQGLLAIEFRRLGERTGPGAGRPAKLYRRATEEVSVSVPDRHYELVADLLAASVTTAIDTGVEIAGTLETTAYDAGRAIGAASSDLVAGLVEAGYEPQAVGGGLVLANCPFHRLARQYTDLVCGLNLNLLRGMAAETSAPYHLVLDPASDRCCVRLDSEPAGGGPSGAESGGAGGGGHSGA